MCIRDSSTTQTLVLLCIQLSDTRILKFIFVSEALVEDFDDEILWTLVPDNSGVTKSWFVVMLRGSWFVYVSRRVRRVVCRE